MLSQNRSMWMIKVVLIIVAVCLEAVRGESCVKDGYRYELTITKEDILWLTLDKSAARNTIQLKKPVPKNSGIWHKTTKSTSRNAPRQTAAHDKMYKLKALGMQAVYMPSEESAVKVPDQAFVFPASYAPPKFGDCNIENILDVYDLETGATDDELEEMVRKTVDEKKVYASLQAGWDAHLAMEPTFVVCDINSSTPPRPPPPTKVIPAKSARKTAPQAPNTITAVAGDTAATTAHNRIDMRPQDPQPPSSPPRTAHTSVSQSTAPPSSETLSTAPPSPPPRKMHQKNMKSSEIFYKTNAEGKRIAPEKPPRKKSAGAALVLQSSGVPLKFFYSPPVL